MAEAGEFDGLRSYKERINASRPAEQARAHYVAAHEEHLSFGYGRHACPGRFFAANEIKMILVQFLMRYDLSMPDGRKERYEQIGFGSLVGPDETKELVLRRIE